MVDRRLRGQTAWILIFMATLATTVSYIDRYALAVLAPRVTAALRISDARYGWLASAFALAYLFGTPLAGQLIDRVGARRGLPAAVLLWSVVAALHALVPGFGVLLVARIALGLAESPSFPAAAQTVHRVMPPEHHGRGLGVLFTGSSIGAALAVPLAVAIERRCGWRVALLLSAVVGLLWLPWWLWATARPGVREALDRGPRDPQQCGPAPGLRLLGHLAVVRCVVVVLACAPAIGFVLTWGSKYLVHDRHLSQTQVGSYLWLPPLLFDLGAICFGDLATRRARGRAGTPDRLLLGVAMLLCTALAAMPWAESASGAVLLLGLSMAGGGGLYVLATHDMLARLPRGVVSTAGGLAAASQALAHIVANPLIGRAVERMGSYTWVAMALGAWVVPGCLFWLLSPAPPIDSQQQVSAAP